VALNSLPGWPALITAWARPGDSFMCLIDPGCTGWPLKSWIVGFGPPPQDDAFTATGTFTISTLPADQKIMPVT
jgi:hypothetical protein